MITVDDAMTMLHKTEPTVKSAHERIKSEFPGCKVNVLASVFRDGKEICGFGVKEAEDTEGPAKWGPVS